MAYTLVDEYGRPQPLRLIVANAEDEPYLAKEFIPYWWSCDPCNRSAERYEVTYRVDQKKPTGLAWYQVVTSEDKPEDVELKLAHYSAVIEARKKADEALREYKRLNGGL